MNNLTISKSLIIFFAISLLATAGLVYNLTKHAATPQATTPPKQWIVCGSGQCTDTDSIQVQGQCAMTAEQAVFCTSWSAIKNPNKK